MALKAPGKLVALVSGAASGFVFYRWLQRSPAVAEEPFGPDPRAEELRAKLEQEPPAEPAAEPAAEATPEERRDEVHGAAWETVRAMRRSSGS